MPHQSSLLQKSITTPDALTLRRVKTPDGNLNADLLSAPAKALFNPGDLVFDVGANIGAKAVEFLAGGAHVVCFEPQPDCVAQLRLRFAGDSRVVVEAVGLAAQPGELEISICSTANVISTFAPEWKQGRFANYQWDRRLRVPVTTLDAAIARHGRPAYIKVDVEGFELDVLRGLSSRVPLLSFEFTFEFLERNRDCARHLESLGFREFNAKLGTAENYLDDNWLSAGELFAKLRSSSDTDLWGDIYARSEVEGPPVAPAFFPAEPTLVAAPASVQRLQDDPLPAAQRPEMTSASSPVASASAAKFQTLLTEARRVLAAYAEQPGDAGLWQELLMARREIAATIANLPTAQKTGPLAEAAFNALHVFAESGVADQPATAKDLALVEEYHKRNWPGLLASMLLVPAWQWPTAPVLDGVPPWLWAEYTRWLFYTPKAFAACGQASAYAAHYLKRLEELANWGSRNRGSAAVKQALEEYLKVGGCALLEADQGSLRRHAECRAKVLKAGVGLAPQDDLMPFERAGRRLRVGFVIPDLGLNTDTFTALPMFEQLDSERFEAVLFVQRTTVVEVEDYCRTHVWEFHVLPKESDAQLDSIRASSLDVLVFATDVTTTFNDITRLALHRLAPLQVVTNASHHSSGLPEIDLYLSGALAEPVGADDHFSERLGLLPSAPHTFNFELDSQGPAIEWTRASLGLPDEAIVFAATADYGRITPEVQDSWVRLLAVVPGSRLLIHPFHNGTISTQTAKRFCADFDRRLAAHGLADDRLVVMPEPFASRADVKAFLRVADIYLDTYPVGGASALIDPLEIGLPVVVREGEVSRSRRGSALLRTLNLPELIGANGAEYEEIAIRLATDPVLRQACAGRERQQMERAPVFLDTLAASDSFGDLLGKGYDELIEKGRAAFRANPLPLNAGSLATEADANCALSSCELAQKALRAGRRDTTARHAMGRALLDAGRAGRAVTYLLAALQGGENNPGLWRDLAGALRIDGKRNQAIEALETSLRLDPSQAEGWLMLIDLAESSGATDFARESLEALRANSPDNPEIPVVAARLGC